MNQRTTWVCHVVGALAVIAAAAFVPTDAAAQPSSDSKPKHAKVICCILPENGGGPGCAQVAPDHCDSLGGTSLGPGSCQHNPCLSSSTTTTTTTTRPPTTTTTTTIPACCGFSPKPNRLNFTTSTSTGTGNCGTLTSNTGLLLENLKCGGLYTGGGSDSVPLPFQVPDMGSSLTKVATCSGTSLGLSNLTSTDTGSNRNCTSIGCLVGPPLPIPNSATPSTSVCVINTVSANATGTADCSSGASQLSLPLNSEIFLDGDLFPNAPGIQVCPVCNKTCNAGTNLNGPCSSDADCPGAGAGSCAGSNKCHGGPNDGMACTPAESVVGTLGAFPTTHDCPPPVAMDIGGLPIAFTLSTATKTDTAQTLAGPNSQCTANGVPFFCCTGAGAGTCTAMPRVFCGFCRDIDAAGTDCFEGDPNNRFLNECPRNNLCASAGDPFNCCTGAGTGTCDQAAKPCTDSSQCTDGNGTWPNCRQGNPGAFSFGTAQTITETGSPAGDMSDGLGHASVLVSTFCIGPTFNFMVDGPGDLPGPGAVSLPGTAQLLP